MHAASLQMPHINGLLCRAKRGALHENRAQDSFATFQRVAIFDKKCIRTCCRLYNHHSLATTTGGPDCFDSTACLQMPTLLCIMLATRPVRTISCQLASKSPELRHLHAIRCALHAPRVVCTCIHHSRNASRNARCSPNSKQHSQACYNHCNGSCRISMAALYKTDQLWLPLRLVLHTTCPVWLANYVQLAPLHMPFNGLPRHQQRHPGPSLPP